MLEVRNISKTFLPGTVNERKALDRISFELQDGEFVTLIGSNGAGKSTLLGAIAGQFPVDCGRIRLDDEDITALPEHRRSRFIGRLFQDPLSGTSPGLTIEENLALVYLQGKQGKGHFSRIGGEDIKLFRERLSGLGMGLEDRMKQPVGLLSGGQRQVLTLLLATLHPPKLLMLDEHTAA
ncbi:MAG: ATP-binding cassette domain-containing protein, partial [Oscillospiraceae bacterium]|nr:ATP-binding cassette domain-containing protein [Oscillospiraceae bacterium]